MSVMEKTSFLQEEIVIAEKHLRKLSQQLSDASTFMISGRNVQIVLRDGSIIVDGKKWTTSLTGKESDLFFAIMRCHAIGYERIYPRILYEELYPDGYTDPKIINIFVYNIRKKLAGTPVRIASHRKQYALELDPT